MNTTVEVIKQLRSETGAGVMECRKALEQGNQNFEKALAYLREKAALKAKKQTDREALEGKIELYSHNNGRIGVMVEINTETEFASRSEVFRHFAHEIALQITSASPLYVRDEDIPQQSWTNRRRQPPKRRAAPANPKGSLSRSWLGFWKNTKISTFCCARRTSGMKTSPLPSWSARPSEHRGKYRHPPFYPLGDLPGNRR